MPFDEEDKIEEELDDKKSSTLKKVSSQKSIFDDLPKKPTQKDLEKRAAIMEEKTSNYKIKAGTLAKKFNEAISDKTLKDNKNPLMREMEKDLLSEMIKLAIDINNDQDEKEGMGSLSWITLLFKTCFYQRDRINELEYALSIISKRTDPIILKNSISKEIRQALDKVKINE